MKTGKRIFQNQTKKQLFWEIFRFLLVGGTATLVDYLVFYVFRQWILPPTLCQNGGWDVWSLGIATALGFCVGLLVNWVLSVTFVFRQVENKQEASSGKSFLIFALIGAIGLGITELGVLLLVAVLPEVVLFGDVAFLGVAWSEWISKIVMTCIVLVWNYFGRKIFIFKA